MPCPHCKITIIKWSENESAVSAAACQSGEKLFSEYGQEQKYYPCKNEVTTCILFPIAAILKFY